MPPHPLPALIVAAALAPLLADPAAAQNAATNILDAFSSGGDPLSNAFLSRIFGCRLFPGVANCESLPTPVFAEAISLFNTFCLALGMALFAWNASVGIMQTAHEGQVLGQRWSSLWAPVRTLAAAAMLTPLPLMDGYNTIQTAIAWLVRGSTAAASIIWASSASLILNHQAPVTSPAVVFDQQVIGAAWRLAACQSVVQQLVGDFRGNASPLLFNLGYKSPLPAPIVAPDDTDNPLANPLVRPPPPRFGTVASQVPFDVCGLIYLPSPPEIVWQTGGQAEWFRIHHAALEPLLLETRQIANKMIDSEVKFPGEIADAENTARRIISAGESYRESLAAAMPALADTSRISVADANGRIRQSARDRIDLIIGGGYSEVCRNHQVSAGDDWLQWICASGGSGQGWLGAGAWYIHMARFANEAQVLFHARPEADDPVDFAAAASSGTGTDFFERLFSMSVRDKRNRIMEQAQDLEAGVERRWNEAVLRAVQLGGPIDSRLIQDAFASEDAAAAASDVARGTDSVRSWMAQKTREWFLPPATADPMAALVEFGNTQLAWGLGLIVAGEVGGLAGGLGSLLPAAAIVKKLGKAATVIGSALLVSGAFLAFILPMLPFLLWVAAVTGYFILVAEAVVACNLWAVAHLRLDGEGLAGEAARQGYYLLLALTLTPVLMIFGFILGMGIFKVTSTLLGLGIDVALRGLAHDQSWAVWLLGMAVISVVLVIVYVVLAERSFSLVAELPGKVLRWVGATADVSSKEDDRIRATAITAAGIVANTGGKLIERKHEK